MPSLILQIVSWPMFGIALLIFGFAPGALLRLIVLPSAEMIPAAASCSASCTLCRGSIGRSGSLSSWKSRS
jgi:hypothetical protein